MKKFFFKSLAIGLLALFPAMSWAGEKLVNNGSYTNTYVPIYGTYASNYTRVQWIQPSSDLTALKDSDITAMTFHASTASGSWGNAEWDVYVFETTSTSVSSSYLSTAGADKVYSGKLSVSSSKMNIVFDESYTYKGGNLVVDLSQKTKGSYSSVYFYYQSGSYGASRYGYSTSSAASASGTSSYNRPKMTITYEPTPTCKKTKSITVSEITSSGATISWEAVDGASAYDVTVGTQVFSGVTGTTQVVSGLNPNTEYMVSVVTDCGGGDKSGEKSTSFRTECDAISSFPWTEEFNITSGIPDCWDNSEGTMTTDSYKWNYYSTGKSGACVRMNSLNASTGQFNILKSPKLALPAEAQQLSFYYKNPTGGSCELYINDSLIATYGQVSSWTLYEIPMVAFANKNVVISWKGISNWGSGDAYLYLDGVSVSEMPTCLKPTISGCYVFPTMANIEWQASGMGETQYQYVVVAKGSTPDWSSATLVSSTSAEVSSLTANTNYDFYVRSYCSSTDQSEPVKQSFTTLCEPILSTTFPWTENFESYSTGDFNASCWTNQHITGNGTKIFAVATSTSIGNNTKMLQLPDMQAGTQTLLVLPGINIPTANAYSFTLDVYRDATNNNAAQEGVRIFVNNTNSLAGTPAELGFVSRYYAQTGGSVVPAESTAGWYTYEFPIPSSGDCYVIIRGESQFKTATYMDNFRIRLMPTCTKPSDLQADPAKISTNSAELSWTAGGSETAWKMQYKKASASTWTAVEGTVTNPYTLTGLSKGTDYEFQIKADCGSGELSDWTESGNFTTTCDAMSLGTIYDFKNDATGSLPGCWTGGCTCSYSYYDKEVEIPSVTTAKSASSGDAKSIKLKRYNSYLSTWVVMPILPSSFNLADLQVKAFACSEDGYSKTMLQVGVMSDPTDLSTFKKAGNITCTGSSFDTATVVSLASVASYNSTCRYIAFYASGSITGYTAKYVYLDDIQVAPKPKTPVNLRAEDVTKTTATIKFWQEDSKGKWNIQVADNNAFTSPIVDEAITDSSKALTGLNGSTNYFVRVQHVDEAYNVKSSWVSSNFSTACDAFVISEANPFMETFEAAQLPACWSEVTSSAFAGNYSSKNIYFNAIRAYFLPEMDFTNLAAANCMFSFDASNSLSNVKILAAASLDGVTPQNIEDYVIATITVDQVRRYDVYLSDYASQLSGKSYIGFVNTATALTIDSVVLKKAPAVRKPKDVNIGNISYNKASIVSLTQEGQVTGGTWSYEIDKVNTFDSEDFSMGEFSEMPAVIEDLDETSTYYVRVKYNVGSDESEFSDVVNFTTGAAPVAIPYSDGFESYSGSSYSDKSGTVPTKWISYSTGNVRPHVISTGSYKYVHAGDKALTFYGSGYCYAAMPKFDVEISKLEVSFWMQQESASNGELVLGYITAADVNMNTFVQLTAFGKTSTITQRNVRMDDFEIPENADRLVFRWYFSGQYSCCIDDVLVKKAKCKAPTPEVSSITTSSAVLSIQEDVAWAYKTTEEGTPVAVAASETISLTDLEANTEYIVYVQSVCSADDKSDFVADTFRTACEAQVALGYEEDFADGIPTCMKAIGAKYNQYGTKYVTMNNQAALILPTFEATTDWSTLQLSFNGSTNSTNSPVLKVIAYDEIVENLADQVVLASVNLAGSMSGVYVYLDEIADINTKMAGKRLGFYRAEVVGVSIDDIAINTASQFRVPTNLAMTAESETAEGADFTFEQTGTPTNVWVVEVSTANTFATVAKRDTITTTSFTLTGLNMKTKYYVRVKQMNGEESSNYSNVVEFTTECGQLALNTVYDMENFTAGTSFSVWNQPNCWGFACGYQSYEPYVYNSTTYNHTTGGSKSMVLRGYSNTSSPSMFTMPVADADLEMTTLTITFWAKANLYSGSSVDLKVGVLNAAETYSSSAFKVAETKQITSTMTQYTVNLSGLTLTEAHKYIAFVMSNTNTSNYIYVDDIEVTINCANVEDAAASDITAHSATISITNETPNWNIVVKAGEIVAFEQDSITDANVSATGLNAETAYEAIITMNCVGGVVSDPDTVEFTTTAVVWEPARQDLVLGQLGTMCAGKNILDVRGGILYGIDYGTTQLIEFVEKVLPIAAGEPLLFQADGTNDGKMEIEFGTLVSDTALHDAGKLGVKGLVGLVSGANVAIETGNILVNGGKLHLVGSNCFLSANHAYIKASELPKQQSSAPGRRLVLTQQGSNVITDFMEVKANEEGVFKFVRDGQMFILRDGKLFNAQGQIVK